MISALYVSAAGALFASGTLRLWYRWRTQQWVERVARTAFEGKRAIYGEVPAKRRLGEGELTAERRELDAVSSSGLRALGDYVEVYAPGSRFASDAWKPIRVLVDADGAMVVLLFALGDGVRIHIASEVEDGRWVLTENNLNKVNAVMPDGFDMLRLPVTTSLSEMVARHRARLDGAPYRGGGAKLGPPVETFEDFVSSHDRRWNKIRAYRRSIGWIVPSEVRFAPKASASQKERVYEEIRRLIAESGGDG